MKSPSPCFDGCQLLVVVVAVKLSLSSVEIDVFRADGFATIIKAAPFAQQNPESYRLTTRAWFRTLTLSPGPARAGGRTHEYEQKHKHNTRVIGGLSSCRKNIAISNRLKTIIQGFRY